MLSLALIGITLLWGNLMTLEEWKEKNKYAKKYAHFDRKISLDKAWPYISNPDKVKHHGFYSFIHYTQEFTKYSHGIATTKTRELCYSAHIDRYIFSYYGFLINQKYNDRVIKDQINEVAIAYRNNLKRNNIHFAKQAIDFIRSLDSCYIILGDFKSFFDNLDHKYLKRMLCDLLEVDKLPEDYYAVFKNITKYSKWELTDILSHYKLKNCKKDISKLNDKEIIFSINEYRNLRKNDIKKVRARKNEDPFGIPQGSAISAVLSNVYMLEADKKLNEFVKVNKGLYMRYSDDIIIVFPKKTEETFKDQYDTVMEILHSIKGVELEKNKTQVFEYDNTELHSCNELVMKDVPNGLNQLHYLGFTFDGKEVIIRDKTTSKYYYRMYRKLKTIVKCKGITKNENHISNREVYEKYSIKGACLVRDTSNKKGKGNFISYVRRAQKIWGPNEPIDRSTKRHMLKIRRQLDKI